MSNQHVKTLGDHDFDAEVLRSDSPLPVLVEFGAAWCGPCKAMRPVIERLAASNADRLRVAEVDMDDAPGVSSRLGIRGVPTVVVFQGGREIGRHLGATTRERLLALCGLA